MDWIKKYIKGIKSLSQTQAFATWWCKPLKFKLVSFDQTGLNI